MSRILTSALVAKLGLTVTQPGYLVSFAFSTPVYWSSLGDVTWNGQLYTGADLRVEGLSRGETSAQRASLSIGNLDLAVGAIVLNEGVADKAVNIYTVYSGATATDDVVQEFSGVGAAAEVDKRVIITMNGQGSQRAFAPRRRISPDTGFNYVLPAGSIITVSGEFYKLER